MMDEAKAERIRASRGNHEAEVSCTGEAGLHQCAIMCQKNPGHQDFIPTNNFNSDHLPLRYRDSHIVDYVRATSDLTCRLSVTGISGNRPDTWSDSEQAFPFSAHKGENSMMTGTGWVSGVYNYAEEDNKNCECETCHQPGTHTPKNAWGEVYITTASHVVYDDEEARHTNCQFFYDSHETDINKVLTLTGFKVWRNNTEGDWCVLKYVTHDVELLDKFKKMYWRWRDLGGKFYNQRVPNKPPDVDVPDVGCDTKVGQDLCIVVSHPHGCSKVVSVGAWTHRHVVGKYGGIEDITYSYNTPTCPGSSGAPIMTLSKDNMRAGWFCYLPAHSEGGPGNDNSSGRGEEWFYHPRT